MSDLMVEVARESEAGLIVTSLESWIKDNEPEVVAEAIRQWLEMSTSEIPPIPVFLPARIDEGQDSALVVLKGMLK